MNRSFYKYYNDELYYIKELAEEFSSNNPRIAQALGLNNFACADPYVERLLEGFAFMAARVKLKLDSEFSRFTQTLMNGINPQYYIPTPSMGTVKFVPDYMDKSLADGICVPRNTVLAYKKTTKEGLQCKFSTAHEMKLWPIRVQDAQYYYDDVEALNIPLNSRIKSCISIGLESTAGLKFRDIKADSLDINLDSFNTTVLNELYSLLLKECLDIYIQYKGEDGKLYRIALANPKMQLRPIGFEEDETLLPYDSKEFQVHRIIREYFAYTKRFYFLKLDKLADAFKQINASKIEVIFTLGRCSQYLTHNISKANFSLYSTPVVNLFHKRLDRVRIRKKKNEFHVVADSMNLDKYEVVKMNKVTAMLSDGSTLDLKPIYFASEFDYLNNSKSEYYTINRRHTDRNEKNAENTYRGSEVYISLLNLLSEDVDIEELSVEGLCNNRNLPNKLQTVSNNKNDFNTSKTFPVKRILLTDGFSRPRTALHQTNSDWDIINHIKHDYLSLFSEDGKSGADIIKKLLVRYADKDSKYDMKMIESIISIKSKQIIKRVSTKNGLVTVKGTEVSVEFDKNYFNGSNNLILEMIINRIFQESVPINTFVETVILNHKQREVSRWVKEDGITLVR
jgi:type VI secretion system protein ImpG